MNTIILFILTSSLLFWILRKGKIIDAKFKTTLNVFKVLFYFNTALIILNVFFCLYFRVWPSLFKFIMYYDIGKIQINLEQKYFIFLFLGIFFTFFFNLTAPIFILIKMNEVYRTMDQYIISNYSIGVNQNSYVSPNNQLRDSINNELDSNRELSSIV